jgi:uncharacterized membrane protein
LRGSESSRIEAFSDAVFGFALTLLVVSLEAPKTYPELREIVRGFLPFVFTFATICWLWYEHYAFFSRFAPRDRVTIALNCALLFVVLFYVYPLKFLFTLVVNLFAGGPSFDDVMFEPGDSTQLMTIYGLGFIAIFVILSALHANTWRQQRQMRLDALGAFDARAGTIEHLLAAAVGVLSIVIAHVGGDRWAWLAGVSYSLLGPVLAAWGYAKGRRRSQLQAEANLPV